MQSNLRWRFLSYQPVEPLISSFADNAYETHSHESNHERNHEHSEAAIEADVEPDDKAPAMNFTEIENKDYVMPALSLLKQPKKTDQSGEYQLIHENAAKLERTFESFGVKAKVTQVSFRSSSDKI